MDSLALVAGVNDEVTRSLHHRVVTLIPSTLDAKEVTVYLHSLAHLLDVRNESPEAFNDRIRKHATHFFSRFSQLIRSFCGLFVIK